MIELTWPGKFDAPWNEEAPVVTFVDFVGEVSNNHYADNLLFTRSASDTLTLLADHPSFSEHYRGKVALVYIDPPFNTGKAFSHYADNMDRSTWLSSMYYQLHAIRNLLAPNGSIWVHLDSRRQHQMRCLLDEVFGEDAFVTDIIWQKKYKAGNSLNIHSMTNTITVYGRNPGWRRRRGLPPGEEQRAKYRCPDNDPRGSWRLTHAGVRVYLSDLLVSGAMPTNWWPYREVGHGETATRESRALFGGAAFSTPKPEALMARIISLSTDPGDVVLDCYAGSGTTAAVAHKMRRRWVTCEVLRSVVETFTRPRLEFVVAGTDPGGVTEAARWTGGGGFRLLV